MKPLKITTNIGVDAGNIGVCDLTYIERNGGKFGETASEMCVKQELTPGTYNVHIYCGNCWNGEIDQTLTIKTEGTLVLGDVCYLFSSDEVDHEVWSDFLDLTDFLDKSNDYFGTVGTGGDGEFEVTFTITPVK